MSVKIKGKEAHVNKVVTEVTGDHDEKELHGISVTEDGAKMLGDDHRLMQALSSLLV